MTSSVSQALLTHVGRFTTKVDFVLTPYGRPGSNVYPPSPKREARFGQSSYSSHLGYPFNRTSPGP